MAHRQFTDSTGHTWDVWDVHPTSAAQTLAALQPQALHIPEATRTTAGQVDPCHAVAPGLASGWLCFELGAERRRLAPIPTCWDQLEAGELERLRDAAARVPRPEERQQRLHAERASSGAGSLTA